LHLIMHSFLTRAIVLYHNILPSYVCILSLMDPSLAVHRYLTLNMLRP